MTVLKRGEIQFKRPGRDRFSWAFDWLRVGKGGWSSFPPGSKTGMTYNQSTLRSFIRRSVDSYTKYRLAIKDFSCSILKTTQRSDVCVCTNVVLTSRDQLACFKVVRTKLADKSYKQAHKRVSNGVLKAYCLYERLKGYSYWMSSMFEKSWVFLFHTFVPLTDFYKSFDFLSSIFLLSFPSKFSAGNWRAARWTHVACPTFNRCVTRDKG